MSKPRVLAAMSGGVDSSVAARLLLDQGYDVLGFTALLVGGASAAGPCCGMSGIESARAVCAELGIEHRVADLSELFEKQVVGRFLSEYQAGRTPNPCTDCNRFLKFDAFVRLADDWDCALVATGHYARLLRDSPPPSPPRLACGLDPAKDQSYFLACVAPENLSRVLFPLGGLTKAEVRRHALAAGLPSAGRRESQDLCFVANGAGRSELLHWYLGQTPSAGRIVDEQGQVLGEHPGVEHFTVGQRKGLRLGGGSEGLVVHHLEPATNTVVVAPWDAHPVKRLVLTECVDLAPDAWRTGAAVAARARYRQELWPATVAYAHGAGPKQVIAIDPLTPQYGLARGQWCVAYAADVVLLAGVIDAIEYGG